MFPMARLPQITTLPRKCPTALDGKLAPGQHHQCQAQALSSQYRFWMEALKLWSCAAQNRWFSPATWASSQAYKTCAIRRLPSSLQFASSKLPSLSSFTLRCKSALSSALYLTLCIMYLKAVPLLAPVVLGLALPAPVALPAVEDVIPAVQAELLKRQISSNGGK